MFLGTTPAVLSQYIRSELQKNCPQRALVPFTGNFIIPQVCRLANKNMEVHSADISIYSMAIGYGLAGMESDIKLSAAALERYPGFAFDHTPRDIAIFALFFSDVADAISPATAADSGRARAGTLPRGDTKLGNVRIKIRRQHAKGKHAITATNQDV